MSKEHELKNIVKEKYSDIALNVKQGESCCGPGKIVEYTMVQDNYENLDGYLKEADLKLGCGMPTEYAGIKKGDIVVDLGSGAGNDVFVARALVGESGKVYGIDFTQEMINKANKNREKTGFTNVEFVFGEIENMPLPDNTADVVVSNCVLNLVPNKKKAFQEIFRIMKPGSHFCVSDIVIKGKMDPELQRSAEMYAGCVSGAIQQTDYLDLIKNAGFTDVVIKSSKVITMPDITLSRFLDAEGIKRFRENLEGIFSITVVGYKK